MKNLNKRTTILICITIIISLLIGGGLSFLKYNKSKVESSSPPTSTSDEPNDTDKVDSNDSNTYPAWDVGTTYNTGDRVSFNGKIYEAKWWTQGEYPDKSNEWGVWTFIGDVETNVTKPDTEKSNDNSSSTASLSGSKFKVIGYFPNWKPEKEKEIQYGKLTHLNYAFAIPNNDGTLKPLAEPELAKKIIKNGHKNDVKVLIAVGGWEYNGTPLETTFIAATDTDDKCKKLAGSILSLVDEYGFDGVDMDWEHPRTDGNSKIQYANLLKYLRNGINKKGKILSAAVQAGVNADGNVSWDAAGHTDAALSSLDWINVMAYDGGDGDRHSSFDFSTSAANYWIKTRKLPQNKVVLGLPFYGRPSWASYEEILKADSSAFSKDKAMIDGKEAYYNGIDTIKKKTKWAMENASGIMIWEISQDTPDSSKSLLNAIYETVK